MDTDLDVADESPVQVPLVPESAINFTLNAVTAPSSSIEEIPRGPATPAPAARSAETTSVLLGAPGSAAPLCAQNKGAQGAPPSSASLPHPPPPAPLAPGFSAPVPPRAHHAATSLPKYDLFSRRKGKSLPSVNQQPQTTASLLGSRDGP